MNNFSLLRQLCEIHAPSGEELPMKQFLLKYIDREKKNWKAKPQVIAGDDFQDCIIGAFETLKNLINLLTALPAFPAKKTLN